MHVLVTSEIKEKNKINEVNAHSHAWAKEDIV